MRHEDVRVVLVSMRASGIAPPIRSLGSREAGGQTPRPLCPSR